MAATALRAQAAPGPFDAASEDAYLAWRAAKLAAYPCSIDDLVVAVRDPRALTRDERLRLADRCARANMAIYATGDGRPDKDVPRALARQLGLAHLDHNWLADDDGISSIAATGGSGRGEYIPYTRQPIRWHTDGYYNPPQRRIRAMVLHCVTPAARGGENALLDHEVAYILLRDEDPRHVQALMQPDAMTIPARTDENDVVRPAQAGPVFTIDAATGALHMRYTARTRSIVWKDDPAVQSAAAALARMLAAPSRLVHRVTLAPGMGIVCNNVLHDRSGFDDDPSRPRLVYRARYHDRIGKP